MREGHILYIDEINMAKPETLPILNGVLDYRRQLTNPFYWRSDKSGARIQRYCGIIRRLCRYTSYE